MAKLTAPLMSLAASGSIGGTLTFANWKGIPYVRQLVIPANPQTELQVAQRGILGTLAKAMQSVYTANDSETTNGSVGFKAARDAAPSGQSWASYFVQQQSQDFDAAQTAYDLLNGTKQGYFDVGATAAGLASYTAPGEGGITVTGGEQLFMLARFGSLILNESICDTALDPGSQGDVDALVGYWCSEDD